MLDKANMPCQQVLAACEQTFSASKNFGGIIGLATEVVAKKVSSEEEKYSDHSWLIFYNNYKGIYSQVALLRKAKQGLEIGRVCINVY